eukprot:GHVS01108825.1.p1 GENE.GHVS01108825.1~~GHVS01108825.1.p1  ORF type:complete len:247 (+),score=73.71 GHVS01108825.1:76-816(+)
MSSSSSNDAAVVSPPSSSSADDVEAALPSVTSRCMQWQQRVDTSLARKESDRYVETQRDMARKETEDRRVATRVSQDERRSSVVSHETDEVLAKALADSINDNRRRNSQIEIERVIQQNEQTTNNSGGCLEDEQLAAQLEQEEEDLALAALMRKQEVRRASGEVSEDMDQEDKDMLVALQLQEETERSAREEEDEKLAKQLMESEQQQSSAQPSSHPQAARGRPQTEPAVSIPKKLMSLFSFGRKK